MSAAAVNAALVLTVLCAYLPSTALQRHVMASCGLFSLSVCVYCIMLLGGARQYVGRAEATRMQWSDWPVLAFY